MCACDSWPSASSCVRSGVEHLEEVRDPLVNRSRARSAARALADAASWIRFTRARDVR